MGEIKIELDSIRSPAFSSQHDQTTFPDRQADNRPTSLFLGSPLTNNSDQSTDHIKRQIAFIQSQVVYDVELKVSSLSGLRFLFQQQQRLATKYRSYFAHGVLSPKAKCSCYVQFSKI